MLAFKPFIRITILSLILTLLLIFLGVKYHWGDHLQTDSDTSIVLSIPDNNHIKTKTTLISTNNRNLFEPKIIKGNQNNSLLASMNKEQITEHCINLLSKEIKDSLSLELATVNCVVSNYQETFQNSNTELAIGINNTKSLFQQQCTHLYNKSSQYSILEKKLLIGICTSDRLNRS